MGSEIDDRRSKIEEKIDDAKKIVASWADDAKAAVVKLELFNQEEHKSRVRSFDSQAKLDAAKLECACLENAKSMRGKPVKNPFVCDGMKTLLLDKYYSASSNFESYDGSVRVATISGLPKHFIAEISWMLTAQSERAESNVSVKTSLIASADNWLRAPKATSEIQIDRRSPSEICADMAIRNYGDIRASCELPRIPRAAFMVALEMAKRVDHSSFHIVFEPKWKIDQWSAPPIDRVWKVMCAIVPTLIFSAFIQTVIGVIVQASGFLQHFTGMTWSGWYPLIAPAFILCTLLIGCLGMGILAGWIGFAVLLFEGTREHVRRFVMACLTQSLFKTQKAYLVMKAGDAQYKLAQWRI